MKKILLNVTVLLALFVAGTFAVAAQERHPNIRRAIGALENAKIDLQNAAHDFCGHRVEALEAVNNALSQLRLALGSDRAERMTQKDSIPDVKFIDAAFYRYSREPHPKIKAALRALENAKVDLEVAAHDFHGHRVEALEATNNAISQLQMALACDKK